MKKHEIVSLIKPFNPATGLGPLENLAEIGYRKYASTGDHWQNSGKPVIEIYVRDGYKPESLAALESKSGFIALYKDARGSIDFVVLYDGPQGQTHVEQALKDCKEIEGRALRQGILSWPPKFLRRDHLADYGFSYANMAYLGVSALAFFYGFHSLSDKTEKKIIEFMKGYPGIVSVSMAAYMFGFLVSAYLGKWFGPYIGSLGDRLRVRKMSSNVVDYRFGKDALDSIEKDLKEADLEREIIRLFDVKKGRDGQFFRQQILELLAKRNKSNEAE